METERTTQEIIRLRRCINDLASILALPVMWSGHDTSRVTATSLDVLVRLLDLDFAYARTADPADESPREWMRSADTGNHYPKAHEVGRVLEPYLSDQTPGKGLRIANPVADGTVSIAVFHLGVQDSVGVFVAASRRREFPTETERLLLQVATNQAAVALQEARRIEQRMQEQVSQELRRSAFYLAEGQRLSHSGSWSFIPSGICDYWSQELYQILGFDPAKGIPTIADYLNIVHPEDREFVEGTIDQMVAEGVGCDVKERIIRADGELRVIRCVGTPVHENGVVTRFIGTLMDVTDQERMIQELHRRDAYLVEAQRLSRTGSFGWNISSGELFWSRETSCILEYDQRMRPTMELVLQRVHPEDRAFVQQTVARASRDGRDLDFAHRLLMPDRSVKYVHVVARAVRDESGKLVEFIGAVMDVTARRRSQQALESAYQKVQSLKDQFQQAVDTIPGLVWSVQPDGYIDFLNQRWREYTGLTLAEASGWGWRAAIHPDDLPGLESYWRAVLASGTPGEAEARLRRADGEYRWFLFRAVPVRDERGKIARWYGANTDIHDRKLAEEALRALERHARSLVTVRADVGAELSKPAPTKEVLCGCAEALVRCLDAAFVRIWTLKGEADALELQASAGLYTRLDGSFSHIEVGALKVGRIAQERKPHLTNDVLNDPQVWDKDWARSCGLVAFAGYPLIVDGRVVGVMALFARHPLPQTTLDTLASVADAIAQGIERKRAEEALRESEERFRWMGDAIPEVIWFMALEPERVLYVSPSFERIWGLPVEDLYRNPRLRAETILPEDRDRVTNTFARWIAGEKVNYYNIEYRILQPNGAMRWIHERGVLRHDDQGKPYMACGISTDITERKHVEDEVRAARVRFEGILGIAEDAIVSVDSNQRIMLFNRGAEKIFGYTQTEVLGRPLDLLLPQRFANVHRKHFEEFARSPDVARTMGQRREVSGRRKDGREFPAEASISKLDLGGELVFTVILRDITERKRAEQRLVAQHTVTQVLAEAATLEEATPKILQAVCECLGWDLGELWRIDRAAGVLRCVEVWHKESIEAPEFGATSHDRTFMPGIGLPGRVWSSREPAYIPDVVQDSNFPRAPIAAREGLHAAFGFPILLGSEVVGVMDFFSREIRQPDQDLLDMMATIGSQIGQFTDRKRAEEELRRSEFYLVEGQRLAHMGSWAFNPSGCYHYWSQELFRIYGLDPATPSPTLEEYLALVHPEDRAFMASMIQQMLADQSGCDVTKRIVRPDGELRYVRCVGVPVVVNGTLKSIVGTAMDVTEQERLTQELSRRGMFLAEAQGLSHTGSFDWNVSSGEILWSEETFRIFEYDRATCKPTVDLLLQRVHPEDIPLVQQTIGHASKGNDFDFEHRLLMPDGSVKHVHVVAHAIREKTDALEFVGAVTDITDRKRAEEALQQSQAALAHATRVTTLGALTASIAHEINQPLAAMVTNANACVRWLAGHPPNLEEVLQTLRWIVADGYRAGEVLGRIRGLVKKAPPQKTWMDINYTIGEVLALARSEVRRQGVALEAQLAPELPPILGDRIQVQQVLLNLILNGVEAVRDVRDGPREVLVSSESDGARGVRVAVRDSGPGLDAASLGRLFDAFYTTKPEGLGMGLAISRSIIEVHGGRLWATPNSGPGATFQFTLPAADANQPARGAH